MQKFQVKNLIAAVCFLVTTGSMVGCTKDTINPSNLAASTVAPTTQEVSAPTQNSTSSGCIATFNPSAKWKSRPDGIYTLSQATQDYSNSINGWADTRMAISGGKLRTTLTKGTIGPDGGLVSWVDVPDGSEYQLQFDVMFDPNFDFSWGGKLGFGFLIGDGNTGGQSTAGGTGASARIMWYKNYTNGPVFLKPYLYYRDQPGTWGDDFGKAFPSNGTSIQKGTWYTVKMYVKSNTGSNTNGRIKLEINGSVLMDQAIRWTTDDTKRLINRVTFETFRGGSESYWQSPSDGQIFFDNVTWTELAN